MIINVIALAELLGLICFVVHSLNIRIQSCLRFPPKADFGNLVKVYQNLGDILNYNLRLAPSKVSDFVVKNLLNASV